MPKVSVIIPNYNHARFLEQRIDSVLNQTFQDFEIIFLDDKSQDNSQEIFAKYANHPKISHTIFNETNSGSPFKQWDKGFALATGEYIWIAESDDYANPTILEKLVQQLDTYASVGLAYSQSWKVDDGGNIISKMNYLTDVIDTLKWENDYIASGMDECSNCLGLRNIIPNASAVLFRRCFITELDSDIKSFKLCGDWLFWIKILLKCDVAFIAEPLNYFRFHQNTARSLRNEKLQTLERIKIVNYLLQSVKIPDKIFYKIQDDLLGCYFNYYNLHPVNYQEFREFVEIYKQIIGFSNKLKHYLSVHIILFKKTILVLKFKLAIRTKIKQFLELPQIG
jgi:glycosyltransferase involved in cell wall biosynthesis